jgi:hypothetical protein
LEEIRINQQLERLEALKDSPRLDESHVQMMKVGEEKAIDLITCFEAHMNEMETQLGRVMAKGNK